MIFTGRFSDLWTNGLDIKSHLEKMPFRLIAASRENEKCSHMTHMLRFLISLFLDFERKFLFFKAPVNDGLVKTLISRYPVIPAFAGMTDQMTFFETIINRIRKNIRAY